VKLIITKLLWIKFNIRFEVFKTVIVKNAIF
jgi:hypothetical protein